MTNLSPNDLSHLSDEEFNALAPQGYHATGQAEPLSPAAQSVLDAYRSTHLSINNLVAALRAAADQAHPKAHIEDIDYVHQSYVDGWKDALDVILAIADELDNTNNTSEKTNGQD